MSVMGVRRRCMTKHCTPGEEARCTHCPEDFPSLSLMQPRVLAVPKPRLRPWSNGIWSCAGIGYGQDAEEAYTQWREIILRRLNSRGLEPDRQL